MVGPADALGDATDLDTRFRPITGVTRLADLEPEPLGLGPAEMALLVAQARELLAGYYVHLPLKRALYAVDPLGRLDALAARIAAVERGSAPSFPDEELHDELSSIFLALRDLHTSYTLPEPHRSRIAFLPFLVAECDGPDGPIFPVTRVHGTFTDPDFRKDPERPVLVTHWNGVPIDRAVMRHAERTGGSNRAARRARAVERLTFRWLGRFVRPDEDWVVVSYTVGDERRELRFPWLVTERPKEPAPPRGRPAPSLARGEDEEGQWIRWVRWNLFAGGSEGEAATPARRIAYREVHRDGVPVTEALREGEPRFGHLRIFSFGVARGEVGRFVRQVRRLIAEAPPDGLVVDLRGNPGGDIVAAEELLQLLSPAPIEPLGMDFLNTPQAGALAEAVYRLRGAEGRFEDVLREATATAAQFLPSPPLQPRAAYNALGQAYQGPVVLVVDALSYSAADVFAASFQDHDLGPVVGPDPQTGGGGGNVWPYEGIRRLAGAGRRMPRRLPGGASFDVAVRRTTRVARRAGATLEDQGVVLTGDPLPLTLRDVLGDNRDLLAAALAALPDPPAPCRLRVSYRARTRCFTLDTEGLARVDVVVDRRPLASVAQPDGARVALPEGLAPRSARFLGYTEPEEGGRPAVSVRWRSRGAGATPPA